MDAIAHELSEVSLEFLTAVTGSFTSPAAGIGAAFAPSPGPMPPSGEICLMAQFD
jgi:hypothetical protein